MISVLLYSVFFVSLHYLCFFNLFSVLQFFTCYKKAPKTVCLFVFFYIRTINQDCVYEVNQCAFLVKLLSVDLYWGLFPLLRSLKKKLSTTVPSLLTWFCDLRPRARGFCSKHSATHYFYSACSMVMQLRADSKAGFLSLSPGS